MPIVSLIARPGGLEPALVSSLQGALGGGDALWLSPDEACEFLIDTVPSNVSEIRKDVRNLGTDLNVVAAANRRKRLLVADMDSTMIQQECIDELAAEAGVGDRVAEITARAMNGELDFETAIEKRVGLLAGLPVSVISSVLESRITLMPGGRELVATMKANGAYAALVSGGFTQFTSAIAEKLGFDEHRANQLVEDEGTLTGDVGRPILGRTAKTEALMDISGKLGLTPEDALAVGDGANDLGMIERAGMGVALHAKPVVAAAAPVSIESGDLSSLLFLQGYSRSDFCI